MQCISTLASDVLKMRKKNKKKLGLLLSVIAMIYFEAVKARLDSLSRVLAILIKIIVHQIRLYKPKSKRMQYIVLLGAALITKYLTRLEVFPDDLDQVLNLPGRPQASRQQFIELTLSRAKNRLISDR